MILVSGEEYIDSLSSSNLSGRENIPILLNLKNNLREDVENYIKYNKVSSITLVGGIQTLSSNAENSINNLSKTISNSFSKPIASNLSNPSEPSQPSNPQA